jgi:hypothetical protein
MKSLLNQTNPSLVLKLSRDLTSIHTALTSETSSKHPRDVELKYCTAQTPCLGKLSTVQPRPARQLAKYPPIPFSCLSSKKPAEEINARKMRRAAPGVKNAAAARGDPCFYFHPKVVKFYIAG